MDSIDDTDYCERCADRHATICPDDVERLARVLMGGGEPCEGSLSDANEVLLWARHGKGREVFARVMSRTGCRGRHVCEPPAWPTSLDETWTCPECSRDYVAFQPEVSHHVPARAKQWLPSDTLGWRSAP